MIKIKCYSVYYNIFCLFTICDNYGKILNKKCEDSIMKFLHIGDLHLGKKLNDVNLLEDQIYVLNQIVEIAKDKHVDAVLIAGDIYDKSNPSSFAMSAFNDFLTSLVNLNIKVFIISGNHDSDQRISYFSNLIKNVGVYVSEKFEGKTQKIELEDDYGKLNIHLLPFVRPANVRKYYPDLKIDNYQDAIKIVLQHSNINYKERNILLAHQFITGSIACDSEEMSIGGLDNIDANVFEDIDYVALGHIHRAQKILRDTLRYSGSIMKYSFSEVNHKKSVCIIEMNEKDNINIDLIPLTFMHDVRELKGSFKELMSMDYSEDYIKIIITDEIVDPDARVTLSTVFPNMMSFVVQNSKVNEEYIVNGKENIEDKSISDLFVDFYSMQNNGVIPSEKHLELVTKVLNDIREEE